MIASPYNLPLAFSWWFLDIQRPVWLSLIILLLPVIYLWQTSRVPSPPIVRIASLALRIAVVLALILSLCGARLAWSSKGICVAFLVDSSQSVSPDAREKMRALIAEQVDKMNKDDQYVVIEFGGDAALDNLPGPKGPLPAASAVSNPSATDIARALRLATASFPADRQKRIILISDGNQNVGDAVKEARLAALADVDINTVTLTSHVGHEVMIEQVMTPPRVQKGAHLAVRVVVSSDIAQPAKLMLTRDGDPMASQPVELKAGTSVFDIDDTLSDGGFHKYDVTVVPINPDGDTFSQNNTGSAFTYVDAPGKVLVVPGGSTADADYIVDALRQDRLNVDIGSLPTSQQGLLPYDCVILQNVSARYLLASQESSLANWVKDSGGGLIMVGGDNSFGPGGYADTPLEEVAPVEMDVKRKKHLASLALAIVMDKSGSMGAPAGGVGTLTKMDLCDQGAWETIRLLDESDEANIGAVDTEVKWMLEPAASGKVLYRMTGAAKAEIKKNTLAVEAGGGGIFCKTALAHAYKAVLGSSAMSRHVIMFADAADSEQQEDCFAMADKYFRMTPSITTSVIGMGTPRDSDYNFQKELAEKHGHGRFYITNNVMDLPKFFAKEAFIASRNAFVEKAGGFTPTMYESPLLQGLLKTGVPKLYGYVGTTLKSRATMAAHGLEVDDPVLAHWVIGLGKCVAFTSDGNNRWSKDWVRWPGYAQFWGQTVKWASKSIQNSQVATSTTINGTQGHVAVEAAGNDGRPINDLRLKAKIVPPDSNKDAIDVDLVQTGPGRYEVPFAVRDKGTYIVNVTDQNHRPLDVSGAVMNYDAEFRDLSPNTGLMKSLADLTGGQELKSLDGIFQSKPNAVVSYLPLLQWLLIFSAYGLLVDIAARRLNWADLLRRPAPRPIMTTANSGSAMGAFKAIKSGTQQVQTQREALRARLDTVVPAAVATQSNDPIDFTPAAQKPAVTQDQPAPTPEEAGSYANRLLSAKRRAAEQIKEKNE